MPCYRSYNSPKNKLLRIDKASKAANIRWDKYHESLSDDPIREDLPQDLYRLTFENLLTGKTEVLLFHPGSRINNFAIDVNGRPWKTCGLSDAFERIRKSCNRIMRG